MALFNARPIPIFLLVIAFSVALLRQDLDTSGQTLVALTLEPVASGLSNPVYVTHASDGSGLLFIVEQPGRIRIVQNGSLLSVPFLDIASRVTSGGEMGLLSVAFHPDYRSNRRFFVNYTARRPTLKTIIAEYRTSTNPLIADPNEKVILTIDQPFSNHNGGQLQFGPDGYLYIGMGDGGSGGDPQGHGQNRNSLLGKLLRIDVDSGSPYVSPLDNPFAGGGGAPEIWAYGLRNPWRFSFDRANGRIFLADVGQNTYEEIDIVERSGNYGWNIMEGAHCFSPATGCSAAGLVLPIDEYDHTLGVSVTGGYVYRGSQYPSLVGTYLFGDYGSSRIWGLKESNRGTWSRSELLNAGFSISSFGEDEGGEIYVVNHGGSVHRIRVTSPQPVNNQVLIPSSARSDRFTSLLSVINRESNANQISITSRGLNGSVNGGLSVTLAPGGFYRTTDILGALNLPVDSFGPLTIESSNSRSFIAVSEVRSVNGTAGFFDGQKQADASTERIIAEVIDTGNEGVAGTFRTNLGINNLGSSPAAVDVTLLNNTGTPLGSRTFSVPAKGMLQVDGIIRRILETTAVTGINGYLRLGSNQPIHTWASKIDNRTNDPSLEIGVGEEPSDTGIKLLIPSVSSTGRFKSLLVVINLEDEPNEVILTARDANGNVIATERKTLAPRGSYRSQDVLAEMGAAGSFGPLTLESANLKLLTAISEVRSAEGTAGFFTAVSLTSSTLERVVAEVVDTGDRGAAGTFRTNLGINNLGLVAARVSLQLFGESGELHGSRSYIVPSSGMLQTDNVARSILGTNAVTGVNGYVKLISDQPIHAWSSKINNGTDDPSIVMATP